MKKKSLNATKIKHKTLLNYLKNKKINKVFSYFENYLGKNKKINIGVGVSGGPDSLALTFLTKCFALKNKTKVYFFIVDHKLRKDSSDEAIKVKLLLKKFNINCEILNWRGVKPSSNIQSIARNNRYRLLFRACKKKKINHLLVGHHFDDLRENFFIRLFRGSGLRGLSSFGESEKEEKNNIVVLRPLIKFDKKLLIYISNYVFNFFIKDPSNQNFFFKRTKIRKIIKDLNNEGLDNRKMNLTIKNLKSANNAINFYVERNIKKNSKFIKDKKKYILNKLFFNQPEEIVFRSISIILRKIGEKYYFPRGKSILDVILKIKDNKFGKITLGGCYIEKINETILITKEN